MVRKPYVLAVVLLVTGVLFSACILEYDFERASPWMIGTTSINAVDATGSARGWGGTVTVTLNLVAGEIENVRIEGRRETPSHTRELIQLAQRNAVLFNSFDFLDAMTGATITRNAIREAGESALMSVGAQLD